MNKQNSDQQFTNRPQELQETNSTDSLSILGLQTWSAEQWVFIWE